MDRAQFIIGDATMKGGRRGSQYLQPGNNAVDSNLVPTDQLPASAGSLRKVFHSLGGRKSLVASVAKKGGRVPKTAVLADPINHLDDYIDLVNKSSDAPVSPEIEEAEREHEAGAGRRKRGRPKKGSGTPASSDMAWRRIGNGKMSKLVPKHHHGAYTQIGTNYQLSQFGGAVQPIGNTGATLSPTLSKMSVGAGRKKKPLAGIYKMMADGRKHHCGKKGGAVDAEKFFLEWVRKMYHERGPQIFDNPNLVEELKKILGNVFAVWIAGLEQDKIMPVGPLRGSSHLDGRGISLAWLFSAGKAAALAIGKSLYSALKSVITKEVIEQCKREVVDLGIRFAKKKAEDYLGLTEKDGKLMKKEDAEGAGRRRRKGGVVIHLPIGNDPRSWTPHEKKPIGGDPNTWTPKLLGQGKAKLPHSGEKRNKARGAIVAEVMKKQGLSLAMASKYVKEHGLY